jgi:hypothetical protein
MKRKIRFSVAVACALLLGGFMVLANPFKVTDPSDPRFDPMQFRFEDYSDEKKFQEVLDILFPQGTKRSRVEEILIDHAGLQAGYSEGNSGHYFVSYISLGKTLDNLGIFDAGLQQAQFKYDSNDMVVSIKSHILNGKTSPKFFTGNLIEKGEKP